MSPTRLTVLVSGNGTNLQALIDACHDSDIPNAQIVRVVSNREKAFALKRAANAAIPTCYHNLLKYTKDHPRGDATETREEYDKLLATIVLADSPDIVVCAGWMHVLSAPFLVSLSEAHVPIINLHPALPGAFSGANAIGRAYDAFQKKEISKIGLMIHYVIVEVDMGDPIVVKEVDIKEGETLSELEERFHTYEWKAIVEGTNIAIDNLKSNTSTKYQA